MFWRAYPQGSASIAALAGGEIGANRQVCPTLGGDGVRLRPKGREAVPEFFFNPCFQRERIQPARFGLVPPLPSSRLFSILTVT
jgi:hypothetical protein